MPPTGRSLTDSTLRSWPRQPYYLSRAPSPTGPVRQRSSRWLTPSKTRQSSRSADRDFVDDVRSSSWFQQFDRHHHREADEEDRLNEGTESVRQVRDTEEGIADQHGDPDPLDRLRNPAGIILRSLPGEIDRGRHGGELDDARDDVEVVVERESQMPFRTATRRAQSFGTGVGVVSTDRASYREEEQPRPLLAFALGTPRTSDEKGHQHHDAGREVEVLEERGVGAAGRLEVAEELAGVDEKVGRYEDPDPVS